MIYFFNQSGAQGQCPTSQTELVLLGSQRQQCQISYWNATPMNDEASKVECVQHHDRSCKACPKQSAKHVCDFGHQPYALTSKNKSRLVKVPIHFNVYQAEFLTKMPIRISSQLGRCHRLRYNCTPCLMSTKHRHTMYNGIHHPQVY